jgi:hypothetical protein
MAFISTTTSVYLADTRTQSKVVYLPAASTAQGRVITFKDYFGTAALSTLRISTLGLDRIENTSNFLDVNQDFETIEVLAAGNTNWSILGTYAGGLVTREKSTTVFGIPNLNLWLDGSDSTTMIFGTETLQDILSWTDKSSNAYQFLPVNCNVRSRFSTNCIRLNQSTSHFLSALDIPGSQQQDLFCVLNEQSLGGPLTGVLQTTDLMFFETDGRYHSQFFADGNQAFSELGGALQFPRFFIFQGNLYYVTETNPASIALYSNNAFTLVSTTGAIVNGRGASIFNGRAYIAHTNGLTSMLPSGLISTVSWPASNFSGVCTYENEIYSFAFTSNVNAANPTFKYNPLTGLSTLVAFTNQNDARNFQYNGNLYSMNQGGGGGGFLQILNGGTRNVPRPFWAPAWNTRDPYTLNYIVYSNSIYYAQNNSTRLIEWRQDSGGLYVGCNSNAPASIFANGLINYRGRIHMFPLRQTDSVVTSNSVWTGKGKGVSGGSDFVSITTQSFYNRGRTSVIYDGMLFLGSEQGANILRYGNGATVDVNVSSITGGPRVVMLRKNALTTSMWVNGTELSNKTVSFNYRNTLAQQWYVGGVTGSILNFFSDPGTDHMTGGLHEVMNFTSTLTTDDRQKMEGYLAWKYGVQTNLPAGHPYFSSPPTS